MEEYMSDSDDSNYEADSANASFETNNAQPSSQDSYYGLTNSAEECQDSLTKSSKMLDQNFSTTTENSGTENENFERKEYEDSPDDEEESSTEREYKESSTMLTMQQAAFSRNSEDSPPRETTKSSKKRSHAEIEEDENERVNRQKLDEDYIEQKTFDNIEPEICNSTFNGAGQRIMRKMGYKIGAGLGKNNQGRLEPVQAPKQQGRSGLGHHITELEEAVVKWNPNEEEVKVVEDMEWLVNAHDEMPALEEMQNWIRTGPKKTIIDNETNFCSAKTVKDIVSLKTIFDKLDNAQQRRARTHSNPYETIRGAFFLNRAAVKMANMDKACNFMFTNPKQLQSNELLYFADVCAGPGGFSEYVLWRKKWHAKGFGFTLKNKNDFQLTEFYAGPSETFHPFYGPKGNGDVFDPSNQQAFRELIMSYTNGVGVHFMMSDGGFSVDGQENIQEILSKQLYLCQCIVALMIVRVGGHFVTKLFDLFTPFSAGIIYLMYRCFDEICLFKPNSSRPANSERYLICKGKRAGTEDVLEHFLHVNELLLKRNDYTDVLELVALNELYKEKTLVEYLRKSNEVLGKKQIIGLLKIAVFYDQSTLIEPRQEQMRKQCLEHWEIPDEARRKPRCVEPQIRLNELLGNSVSTISKFSSPLVLTKDNIGSVILNDLFSWYCIPCGVTRDNEPPTFYFGMGRQKVYRYVNGSWKAVDIELELPPNTLVYAEIVYEYIREFRSQQKTYALHILDAHLLGGEDIGEKRIEDRHELIKKFCNALWKPTEGGSIRVRAKELYPVRPNLVEKLKVHPRKMKNMRIQPSYNLPRNPYVCDTTDNDASYFEANSVIFLKSTAFPWSRHFSKTHKQTYFSNSKTGHSTFAKETPASANASFLETFDKRVLWQWPSSDSFPMDSFIECVNKKLRELEIPEKFANIS